MELKVNNPKITTDFENNVTLSFTVDKKHVNNLKNGYIKIKDNELRIDIKKWRERRSLDANAYAWHLIGKIAEALTAEGEAHTKEDIYFEMLKNYGQGGILKVRKDAVEKFKRANKYCEEHEKLFDESAVYFNFWVGSSNYDTREMSLFIKGIVHEAKELKIETKTPDEILNLINLWEQN